MVLNALISQSKLFLSEDMGIDIDRIDAIGDSSDNLVLKDYTSMIGLGGTLNMMVVVSFERDFLEKLVELFMEGEEVEEEEKEEIYNSVSGETINTIIGLSIPKFSNNGKGVTITPPITISDASKIEKYKNLKIATANVVTQYGNMSISVMGSKDLVK